MAVGVNTDSYTRGKKQYDNMVDIVKCFFAVCIVGIHTNVLRDFSENASWYIMHMIFRLGVPFFFLSSAFYLSRKIKWDKEDNVKFREYRNNFIPPLALWGGQVHFFIL